MSSFTRIDSEMLILNASLDIIVKRLRDDHKKVNILQLCVAKLTFIGGQVTIPVKFRSVQPFGLLGRKKWPNYLYSYFSYERLLPLGSATVGTKEKCMSELHFEVQ